MQQKNISLSTQEASIMNTFEMFESNIQIRLPENWNQFDNKFVKRPLMYRLLTDFVVGEMI